MVFSTNQVRQLYVAKTVTDPTEQSDAGTITLKADPEGKNLYFLYKGADNLMRSDIINVDNILWAKAVSAEADSQKFKFKQAVVKLDPDVNDGDPINGQDYLLRIVINPYIGMSGEEPYFKYGVVHATKNMSTGKFYAKLAASLYKNFSRELGKMLEFTIDGKVVGRVKTNPINGEETLIDPEGSEITVDDSYSDGITITEVEQDWTLGIKEQTKVNFTVIPTNVTYDGEEIKWGTVEVSDSSEEGTNSKRIADLEYFCMGERGDQYRNIGWPNSIPTKYLVNSGSETGYNIFEIHYAYVGPNEGPQKSEKDITIVCESKEELNKLITQFADASKCKVVVTNKNFNSSDTELK